MVWYHWIVKPWNGPEEAIQGVIISFIDITDRIVSQLEIEAASQRFQAVLAGTKDGFMLVDTQGRLLAVNDRFCTQTGYSRVELLGLRVTDLHVGETQEVLRQRVERTRQEGGGIFEAWYRRKDGSQLPVEISLSYAPLEDGQFFAFVRDIRDRKIDQSLATLRQELSDLVFSDEQKQLMRVALDTAEELTESSIGFFHFVDPDQETISLQAWSTRTSREMCQAKELSGHYPVSEAGVWVDCIHQRDVVIHNDYAALPHKKGLPEGHTPILRELTVPVFRDKRIVAVIGVGNKPRDYDETDVSLVRQVASLTYDHLERKQTEQRIKYMAFYDVLTGLPNRQLLADRLHQDLALSRRTDNTLAVCYLDLDGFKPINDLHGHFVGDQLLRAFAHRLETELRETDTLARLGGDEFVILLGGLANIIQGEDIIQRVTQTIGQPFDVEGHRLFLTASIGVTFFPQDDVDADTLLRHADQAMYQAKESGKNNFKLYNPIQDEKVRAFRQALDAFERGIRESQLLLHFQPRIDLLEARLAGVEALVRWQHPDKGLLYPDQFLPLIENTALEIALDEWVLNAAIVQHLEWRKQGLWVPVSVNLCPRHIQQASFPSYLADLLSGCPADMPRYLELEVLETSAIGDTAHVADIMRACTEFGVQFSLDDFGTGYSSLTHFHRLPIHVLKIDQHFVRSMLEDARDQDIVEGVLHLAAALKRPVVAEGVETIELGLMLLQLGCQYAQGYGIARPMPSDRLFSWASQWQHETEWHQLHRFRQGPTEHYEINVAIISHRSWLKHVRHCLDSGSTHEALPILDEAGCQFAHWAKGIGGMRYGSRSSFEDILEKHAAIHQEGIRLLTLTNTPNGLDERDLETLDKLNQELEAMLLRLAQE